MPGRIVGEKSQEGSLMEGCLPERRREVYKTAVRAAVLHGVEKVALTKTEETELEVEKLKMLRCSLGTTMMDRQ